MAEERRRSPRIAVDVPARITIEGVVTEGRLRDVCRDAALVLAERSWPVGTTLSVETELPQVPGTVSFSGPVVRLADPDGDSPGMAILFETIDPQALLRIELFVSDPA